MWQNTVFMIIDKSCFLEDMVLESLRICLEEQFMIKYYLIRHLSLLKIQNIEDTNVYLFQCFIDLFDNQRTLDLTGIAKVSDCTC